MKRIICVIVAALMLMSLSVSFFGCEDEVVEGSSQAPVSESESSTAEESKNAESSVTSEDVSSNAPESSEPDESKPDESKPEESKPDESKPDESKPEESKPDESKPDESKPDESEPDESEPDESEPDESSKPEDKPVTSIKDDPNYTNVALNKTYEKSDLHPSSSNPSWPDEGNKSMTDGKLATGGYSDPAFMGFNSNTDFYRFNGYAYVRVDLGAVYELDKFVAQVATDKFAGAGIYTPEFVRVLVSNDGKEWYEAGVTSHKNTTSVGTLATTLELEETVTARYVEYRIAVGTPGWAFVCEVEAYGIKAEKAKEYPEEDAIDILFIGNSSTYYFSVPDKLTFIAESAGINIDATYCTIGSAWLKDFVDESTVHGKLLRTKLAEKKYDIIVIQENSNADYSDLKAAMDTLVPMLKKAQPNAELMLYERYSSSTSTTQRPISGKKHHLAYTQAAKDFGIEKNAHVADAFLLCYEKYPTIKLHHTDDSHHSHAGGYLSASVMAIEFLGIDLDDVTYTAGLDDATVKALKDIAKTACEEGYNFK